MNQISGNFLFPNCKHFYSVDSIPNTNYQSISVALRMIGRRYSDKVVQKDIKLWPFEVVNKDGKPYVKVSYQDQERTFAPEEISAMVLTKVL